MGAFVGKGRIQSGQKVLKKSRNQARIFENSLFTALCFYIWRRLI